MERDYNLQVPPPDTSPFAEIDGLGDRLAELERRRLREKLGDEAIFFDPQQDDDTLLEPDQYQKIFDPEDIKDAYYACDRMLLKL